MAESLAPLIDSVEPQGTATASAVLVLPPDERAEEDEPDPERVLPDSLATRFLDRSVMRAFELPDSTH